ncbi:hypothetical protein HY629_02790 [Candidatus Uhrbacteria bacterium]|nr:hypothetical protein [Candidatus Uhrbacteria bacterium]
MTERSEEELRALYHVADILTPLDGYDISRSNRRVTALVVVQDPQGMRELKLYSWINKGGEWKVDLARLDTERWDFPQLAFRAQELREKYIGRR